VRQRLKAPCTIAPRGLAVKLLHRRKKGQAQAAQIHVCSQLEPWYILRMKRLLAAAMLTVACSCFAQSTSDSPEKVLAEQLEQASGIADPTARLQAYDRIIQDYELASQSMVQVQSSKWVFSSKIDPLDNSQTALFTLESDSKQGKNGNRASLVLMHTPARTEVFINWNLDVGPVVNITWSIDSEDAQTEQWSASENHKATFYDGNPVAIIEKLKNAGRLVAEISPAGQDSIRAQFDVRGLREAINRYAKDIGW